MGWVGAVRRWDGRALVDAVGRGVGLRMFAVPALYASVELGTGNFRFDWCEVGYVVLCLCRGIAVFREVCWRRVRVGGIVVVCCWDAGVRAHGRFGRIYAWVLKVCGSSSLSLDGRGLEVSGAIVDKLRERRERRGCRRLGGACWGGSRWGLGLGDCCCCCCHMMGWVQACTLLG